MGYLITFENSNQKIMKKILFSLLLAFPFSLFSQCPEQVGLQLYSFRNEIPKDVPGTIAKIAAMGFKKVEFSGTYGLSLVDYKKLMDQHGLKVIAVGADFGELQDPVKRKEIMDRAKFLGSTYIITYWIGHKGNEFGISDVEKTVQVFNEAGKEFSKNGYQFLYHVHGYEFRPYKLGYLMDELIQKTDPKYVNYEMDIYWVFHPGHNPALWLQKYPTRWKALHIKDRRIGTPGNQFGSSDVENDVTVGTGELNMKDIMEIAKKNGIKHYMIEDESSRSMQQVPETVKFLSSFF